MAKESYVRNLTSIFETTQATAGTMSSLFAYGLPLNYYSELPQKIDAVTPAIVQQMAQKYLWPDKMLVVVAGDRAKVETGLKELNLGVTEARSADANQ